MKFLAAISHSKRKEKPIKIAGQNDFPIEPLVLDI
jgi:hypothetical protein